MSLAERFRLQILSGAAFLSLVAASLSNAETAAAIATLQVRFDGHQFTPQTLPVPAHRPLVLTVINASRETIEFESFKLNREVALTPGETKQVRLPALRPGRYDFYDDFHDGVPKGYLIAK